MLINLSPVDPEIDSRVAAMLRRGNRIQWIGVLAPFAMVAMILLVFCFESRSGIAVGAGVGVFFGLCALGFWLDHRNWRGFERLTQSHNRNVAVALAHFHRFASTRRGRIHWMDYELLRPALEFWLEAGMPELPPSTIAMLEDAAKTFPPGIYWTRPLREEPVLELIYTVLVKSGRHVQAEKLAKAFLKNARRPISMVV